MCLRLLGMFLVVLVLVGCGVPDTPEHAVAQRSTLPAPASRPTNTPTAVPTTAPALTATPAGLRPSIAVPARATSAPTEVHVLTGPVDWNTQQTAIIARATAHPFPTASTVDVRLGAIPVAVVDRGGLSMRLQLPKLHYLYGELIQAEVVLRNHGREPLALSSCADELARLVLLDEQGEEPPVWPWSPFARSRPACDQPLVPGQTVSGTLLVQIPPVEQAHGATYSLWAETRFSRAAPTGQGPDNIWLSLETGPLPIQPLRPQPVDQLHATLQLDRSGYRLDVRDGLGQIPSRPLKGQFEAASGNWVTSGPVQPLTAGAWSGSWNGVTVGNGSRVTARAWVGGVGYVTGAVEQIVPGTSAAPPMFSTPDAAQHRTFATVVEAQQALGVPIAAGLPADGHRPPRRAE
ncbi:MAG: hypothetical protein H0X37_02520 [Herpetosiphonaceae bacterium]|nr:hypothetical protein [Herpetosiphonaceae bacterium]